MTVRIINADVMDGLAQLEPESVHCVVTSPPYFGLRDYGVPGQIGLEPTPDAYVAKMVEVFRDVRRALRKDGTCWLNLGDSYAGGGRGGGSENCKQRTNVGSLVPPSKLNGYKPKDLIGIPWRVAFALQADGWVLRQEIIWAKPNPMPESVADRCTKAHEQIFLFAKARWGGPDGGRFASVTDQDARWLAALIDAEGCIVVKRCQHEGRSDTFAPQVSFGSTSRALIDEFVRVVGYGNIAERPGTNAPMYYWQVANNIARDFLHRIYPWLLVKKRQARIGIHVDSLTYFRGGKKPERKQRSDAELAQLVSLWARNKECNGFGNPDLSDVPEPEYGRFVGCERYFYDADAIAEAANWPEGSWARSKCYDGDTTGKLRSFHGNGAQWKGGETRNKRSVWEVPTQPFPEAHFATFPPALIEPCIKAGCPEGGTVLDPFGGSGTTGMVADRLKRNAILIELNPEYAAMAERRIKGDCPMFAEVSP